MRGQERSRPAYWFFINYHAEWVPRRGRAAGALVRRARTKLLAYIELTLFTESDLEREVDKPSQYSESPFAALSSRRPASFTLFLWNTPAVKMGEVKITDDIKIGSNNPCFIIAEVGQNHQGDIEIAKKLIKAAKVSAF